MQRIKFEIENGNSGTLILGGAEKPIPGRSKGKAFLAPAMKAQLENTARVTLTEIAPAKPAEKLPASEEPETEPEPEPETEPESKAPTPGRRQRVANRGGK